VFNDATVWDRIDRVRAPMLRVAAWPRGKSWAMSVTGDVDNVDWLDFWNRWHG